MPGISGRIENFGGEIPRVSKRLLPANNAASARNVKLLSGEARGIRGLKFLTGLPGAVKAYRLPDAAGVDGVTWVGVNSLDINIFRGPLLNDTYDRYYKFGDGQPQYNTLERIRNDDPWYYLGIPAPALNGTITATGGVAADVTRYYVYTLVSEYGEEGPPSSPVTDTGPTDATWNYTALSTAAADAANRNVTKIRIYRTVSGYSITEFFLVAEQAIGIGTYGDISDDVETSRNSILEAEQWFPPVATLQNAILMPNGFFVAWDGRDIYLSESYRPHAWPPPYDVSTEYPVVGAGVFGQSVGIVTEGNPYIGTGITPESLVLTKTNTVEPGLSSNGIVSLEMGVIYPSQNGLVVLDARGATLATRNLLTKNEWLIDYSPTTIVAAQYQSAYVAFYSSMRGFIVDPLEPLATFIQLDRFSRIDSIQTDPFTGEVFVMRNGVVYEWDAVDQPRSQYTWKSKIITTPYPVNLGAASIEVEAESEVQGNESEAVASAIEWNTARFAAGPLDFLGGNAIGAAKVEVLSSPYNVTKIQNQQPIGGSPLISVQAMLDSIGALKLTVYADDVVRYSEYYQGQHCIRLPSGFKADRWQFEITSGKDLYSFSFAETCIGLRRV